ncbi:MAG: T9SS type A sorting domain-containing protein, partial [candidate division KSB1 bacterium]|nr:T9SS type A sorting domain-containing protein [candidate division KSB1 bacterium]
GLSVTEIRQSTDLNSRAIGMKFFNAFNRNGVTIDGVPDSPVLTITDPPDGLNWFMATGEPGTILTLVNVPLIGNARELYYKDNAAVDNADTGDKQSFGDFGLRVTGSNITGSFSFNFTTYFLGRNQAVDIGDQFKQNALNPLQVTAAEQTRSTSAVAGDQRSPVDFALAEARPNPFAPTQGATRIGFSLGSNAQSPSLRVYNLLGQEVARFESAQLVGRQEIVWDGRDQFGRLAPAGIYFYELTVGKQRAVKKLILLR